MNKHIYAILGTFLICTSCSSTKTIYSNNKFYQMTVEDGGQGKMYHLNEVELKKTIKAKIEKKNDYIIISDISKIEDLHLKRLYSTNAPTSFDLEKLGKYYFLSNGSTNNLRYFDIKLGLQALTIPLKFRSSVGNDILNPPTIETGVNVGFAPGWKFTHNIYKTSKNYLGKNTSQYAIAIGPHFGLGTTDLKKTTNAPGVLSDRKAASITYGGYVLMGFNNVNLGFAIGYDRLINQKDAMWIYENKLWKGVIISLDILKF